MAGLDINTKLLLHGNAPDGTLEIVDSGNTGHVVTQVATAQLDTTQKKFGSSSLLLDGNSDYITIPASTDFNVIAVTTEDWTIDGFYKTSSFGIGSAFVRQFEIGVIDWGFFILSTGQLFWNLGQGLSFSIGSNINLSLNTMHHIALVKKGGTPNAEYAFYIDGNQVAYGAYGGTDIASNPLVIGADATTPKVPTQWLPGNIDELRIQKSNAFNATPVVGLTDTITVPTAPHVSDINTKLLLHMDTQDVSGDGGSGNYHIPDFIGTAQIDTAQSKFGGSSYLFDGNSDYSTITDSADWDIASSTVDNWTVDIHFKLSGLLSSALLGQFNSDPGYWLLSYSGNVLHLAVVPSANIIQLNSTTPITDTTSWHHVAIIKVGSDWGIYVDGVQEDYSSQASTSNTSGVLSIGRRAFYNDQYFNGHIDELRIQKSNYFNATPVVGLTDTITVPTQEYSTFQQLNTFNANQGIIIT